MPRIRLPKGEWEYSETNRLGDPGGFGEVFAGKGADGAPVAIRRLKLSASDAAHRELPEITHRDLKPANVLKHDGRWKIADFGIARFVEDATSTRTLRECLSPPYAARSGQGGLRVNQAPAGSTPGLRLP